VENLLHATRSEKHLRDALELTDDPIARGIAALQLAGTLLMSGRAEEALALAAEAVASARRWGAPAISTCATPTANSERATATISPRCWSHADLNHAHPARVLQSHARRTRA
jgi:hypothetical protein